MRCGTTLEGDCDCEHWEPEPPGLRSALPAGPGEYRYEGRTVQIPDGYELIEYKEWEEVQTRECATCEEGQEYEACDCRDIMASGVKFTFNDGCVVSVGITSKYLRLTCQELEGFADVVGPAHGIPKPCRRVEVHDADGNRTGYKDECAWRD